MDDLIIFSAGLFCRILFFYLIQSSERDARVPITDGPTVLKVPMTATFVLYYVYISLAVLRRLRTRPHREFLEAQWDRLPCTGSLCRTGSRSPLSEVRNVTGQIARSYRRREKFRHRSSFICSECFILKFTFANCYRIVGQRYAVESSCTRPSTVREIPKVSTLSLRRRRSFSGEQYTKLNAHVF